MTKLDYENTDHTTAEEPIKKAHTPLVLSNIFQVTFGYYGDDSRQSIECSYRKDIYILKTSEYSGRYPVYAKLVSSRLKELFTGVEIPLPEDESVPGFGAYGLPIYSLRDYKELLSGLKRISEVKEDYKKVLLESIAFFEGLKRDYFGRYGSSTQRKTQLEQELQDYKREVDRYIGGSGTLSM